jgi:hypothetical protein
MLIVMQLHPSGTALVPADEQEAAALERLREVGGRFRVKVRQQRNSGFHRKAMALMRYLHQQWEPQEHTDDGVPVQRDFDAFRRNLLIQAGYFTQVFRPDGSFTLEARSLNFDAMDNVQFSEVYARLIDVGVRLVGACGGMKPEQVDMAVDRVLAFAS